MPDDKMVFGIEFKSNAKEVSKDIKELEKVTDNLDKNGQKRTISDVGKLNNAKKQIEIDKENAKLKKQYQKEELKHQEKLDKEKSKENKKQEKQFKSEIKSQKELDKLVRKRLNNVKKFIIGSVATGSVLKFALDTIQAGRQIDIASKSSLADPKTVDTLGFMLKKFGGDMSSAANTLMSLNDRLYNFSKFGLADNVMQEILTKFPQTFDKIFRDDFGNIIQNPLKVLQNISRVMSTMSDETSRQFANTLGLDNSVYLLLRESNGNFLSLLEEAKKSSFANEETIKKLQNTANLIDETKRSFQTGFATALSDVLVNDMKETTQSVKDIAYMLGNITGLVGKIINLLYKFGNAIGEKFGLPEIITYFMLDEEGRKQYDIEQKEKSYQEYIKNGRRKPFPTHHSIPMNSPLYYQQMEKYYRELAIWEENEKKFNKKHPNKISPENYDILFNLKSANPNFNYNLFWENTQHLLNSTSPKNLFNNGNHPLGNVQNITVNNGDTIINGVDTNNAEQVGKTVQTINEDTAYLYLKEMSSPYSK